MDKREFYNSTSCDRECSLLGHPTKPLRARELARGPSLLILTSEAVHREEDSLSDIWDQRMWPALNNPGARANEAKGG